MARLDPNGWGLFDMLGNVWEWTTSYYSCSYPLNKDKPTEFATCGQIGDMSSRVVRGGSCHGLDPSDVRAAYRGFSAPMYRSGVVGFRCLRIP